MFLGIVLPPCELFHNCSVVGVYSSKVPVRLGSLEHRYEPDGGSERFGSCAVTGSAFHAGPGTRGSTGFGTFGA